MRYRAIWILGGIACFCWSAAGVETGVRSDASAPARVSLTIYDRGFAVVNELRRVTLATGENTVHIAQLPVSLDPASVAFTPLSGAGALEVIDQQYAYDVGEVSQLFERYRGSVIGVTSDGVREDGTLVAVPDWSSLDNGRPLVIQSASGAAHAYYDAAGIEQVTFPDARDKAFLEPTLIWRAEARQEGPHNLRVSYVARDMSWEAFYECVLTEDRDTADLVGRVAVRNGSGGSYREARVKLLTTEKGSMPPLFSSGSEPAARPALRYAYEAPQPAFEKVAAGSGILEAYDLPRPLTLGVGETLHAQLFTVKDIPVKRFFVYDGVRFDRFQRNRRNDWNYGTEYHEVVESHVSFDNEERNGLGIDLPPGRFRLYQETRDENVDLVGEDYVEAVKAGDTGHALVGPALGLHGERERTGYAEVTPLHVYEETFEIRLHNETDEAAEIRVVEHLYRWPEYEIVRADSEYEEVSTQTIEFRPLLNPGGTRSIHYTVRYTW